jgi:hypothetical protein
VSEGELLLRLTDAVIARDSARLEALRSEGLERLGNDALVDALAVAAGFSGINRVADATGTVLDDHMAAASADFRDVTGINGYLQARA